MKKVIPLLLSALVVFSCKNDTKVKDVVDSSSSITQKEEKKADNKADISQNNLQKDNKIVSPCALIGVKDLSKILGVDKNSIRFSDNNNSGQYSKICGIVWNDENRIHLSIQSNPLPGEITDFGKSFIDSKIENGDMGYPAGGKPYKYERLEGFDDIAAYNEDLKRVFWKYNSDYVFSIYFNAGLSTSKRKKYALEISKVINKNFNKKLK